MLPESGEPFGRELIPARNRPGRRPPMDRRRIRQRCSVSAERRGSGPEPPPKPI